MKRFSKPKIRYRIVIVGSLPVYLGAKQHSGLGNVIWGLSNELRKLNESFAILAKGKYFHKYKNINSIDIYGLGFSLVALICSFYHLIKHLNELKKLPSFSDVGRLLYAVYFLLYFMEKIDFDILHIHHVTNHFPLAAKILDIQKPIVAQIHSYSNLMTPMSSSSFRKTVRNMSYELSNVDFIIHVSQSVKEQGLHYGIKWQAKDKIIYNGIKYDLEALEKLIQPTQKGVMCFAGAFIEIKGIEILLKSIRPLKNHIRKIIWIGEGHLRKKIEHVCQDIGIQVEMTGMLPNEKVLEKISVSQLLAVPSLSEGFGQVYAESLLVGTPVIGYHKVINEFKNVFGLDEPSTDVLLPFDSREETHDDLTRKIKYLLRYDGKITPEMKRKILEKIYWGNIVSEYRNIYEYLSVEKN